MNKSATRKELAEAAGVSVRTMRRWLKRIEPQLIAIGYHRNDKILSPPVTDYICRHLAINLNNGPP